jgi:hypothetical protein
MEIRAGEEGGMKSQVSINADASNSWKAETADDRKLLFEPGLVF